MSKSQREPWSWRVGMMGGLKRGLKLSSDQLVVIFKKVGMMGGLKRGLKLEHSMRSHMLDSCRNDGWPEARIETWSCVISSGVIWTSE